jgi:hypothetical protein
MEYYYYGAKDTTCWIMHKNVVLLSNLASFKPMKVIMKEGLINRYSLLQLMLPRLL